MLGVPSPIKYRRLHRHWQNTAKAGPPGPNVARHPLAPRNRRAAEARERLEGAGEHAARDGGDDAPLRAPARKGLGRGGYRRRSLEREGRQSCCRSPFPKPGTKTTVVAPQAPATATETGKLTSAAEERVDAPTPRRPGRPKGKRYPKDDARHPPPAAPPSGRRPRAPSRVPGATCHTSSTGGDARRRRARSGRSDMLPNAATGNTLGDLCGNDSAGARTQDLQTKGTGREVEVCQPTCCAVARSCGDAFAAYSTGKGRNKPLSISPRK